MMPVNILEIAKSEIHNLQVSYGFGKSKFGEIIVGIIPDKHDAICHLHFVGEKTKEHCIDRLKSKWSNANTENNELASKVAKMLFDTKEKQSCNVAIVGTEFQKSVWEALLKIQVGETFTYSDVADLISNPKAIRAVASAVANNDVVVLIPCHRVMSKTGPTKYSEGPILKQKLLEFEKGIKSSTK